MQLIDGWRTELHRLWSIRISLFVGVLTSVAGAISLFDDVFNPWLLLSISIFANTAVIPLARLIQQEEPPK